MQETACTLHHCWWDTVLYTVQYTLYTQYNAHWHIGTVAVNKNIGCWSQFHFSKSGGATTTTVVGHSCGHTVLLQMPCSWSGHCSGVGWYGEGG